MINLINYLQVNVYKNKQQTNIKIVGNHLFSPQNLFLI